MKTFRLYITEITFLNSGLLDQTYETDKPGVEEDRLDKVDQVETLHIAPVTTTAKPAGRNKVLCS